MNLVGTLVLYGVIAGVHIWLGHNPFAGTYPMKLYRFLSEDDTSAFCHKVTAALNKGWALHGGPTYAFDAAQGRDALRAGGGEGGAGHLHRPTLKLGDH